MRYVHFIGQDAGADEEFRRYRRGAHFQRARQILSARARSANRGEALGIPDDRPRRYVGGNRIHRGRPGFFGDDDGQLVALDAPTGRHLWHYSLGQNITASPITFMADGKQYVTIAAATDVFTFALF